MTFADVKVIEISSTRRLIEDQVRIMHDQLSRAKKMGSLLGKYAAMAIQHQAAQSIRSIMIMPIN